MPTNSIKQAQAANRRSGQDAGAATRENTKGSGAAPRLAAIDLPAQPRFEKEVNIVPCVRQPDG